MGREGSVHRQGAENRASLFIVTGERRYREQESVKRCWGLVENGRQDHQLRVRVKKEVAKFEERET